MNSKPTRFVACMAIAMSTGLVMQVLPTQAQVFTDAQAKTGEQNYDGQCAMCHGAELLGPDAPALVGTEVMQNFDTAEGLYGYFSAVMPPQAPGLLDEEVYVNILAYILKANGAQAGTTALSAAPDVLKNIKLAEITSVAAVAPATDAAPADAAPAVPQAYTWGKTLPSTLVEPEAPSVPQAYTWGKTLPTKN